MYQIPTLEVCEKALGEPAKKWEARCYEIAYKIVKAGLINVHGDHGEAVYGHWRGPIHPRSCFAKKCAVGFVQHGWIWIASEGLVVDPTRWVFEAKTPYLFVDHEPDETTVRCKHCFMLCCEHDGLGANDECAMFEPELWPYDEGGNKWREALQRTKPPPKPKAKAKRYQLKLDGLVAMHVATLLNQAAGTRVTDEQIFWLANLSYQTLMGGVGPVAVKAIYEAICAVDFEAFIPVDNLKKATREAGFSSTKRPRQKQR